MTDPSDAKRTTRPPLATAVMCGICVLLFLAINATGAADSWDELARFGYPSGQRVRDGAYWGLVTSAFVHIQLWHVAFNVLWFWTLGGAVERVIGAPYYVVFVIAAAFVSSSLQLVVSGMGHGASGVVYALFGAMWILRKRVPAFGRVLGRDISRLFWIWLFAGIALKAAGILNIGNAAHFGGLAFGVVVGRTVLGPLFTRVEDYRAADP